LNQQEKPPDSRKITPIHRRVKASIVALIFLLTIVLSAGAFSYRQYVLLQHNLIEYSDIPAAKARLISNIRRTIGYGHFIHNFKNYVLRQDRVYLEKLAIDRSEFERACLSLRELTTDASELKDIQVLMDTVADYWRKVATAEEAFAAGKSISEIDVLVRIDDRAAVASLERLDNRVQNKQLEGEIRLDAAIKLGQTVAVASVMLAGLIVLIIGFSLGVIRKLSHELQMSFNLLDEGRKLHEATMQSTADAVIVISARGIIESFNHAAENMFLMQASEVIGKNVWVLMPKSDRQDHQRYLEASSLFEPKAINKVRELQACRRDGSCFPIELNVAPFHVNGVKRYVGVVRDITERKQAEEKLIESEAKLNEVASMSGSVLWTMTADMKSLLYASPALEEIWGVSVGILAGDPENYFSFIHPDDIELVKETIEREKLSGWRVDYRVIQPNGKVVWVSERGKPVCDESGNLIRLVGVVTDISQRKQLEERLTKIATLDHLTCVNNRHALFNIGDREISRCRRHGGSLSLVLLDADHFKQINDRYGHLAGDEVLVRIAAVCRSVARQEDVVARYGGEEFILLLPDTSLQDAMRVAERLRESIAALEVMSEAGRIAVTISCGVSLFEAPMKRLADLIDSADRALYAAKANGRNQTVIASEAP
jgi:diguanylate cyclase (GGDEF)-like protein/PAS domain S-box-containing protein